VQVALAFLAYAYPPLPRIRTGMRCSTAWFIVVATGATLRVHNHPVQTGEDAARARPPGAGAAAMAIFSVGLLACALPATPVQIAVAGWIVAAGVTVFGVAAILGGEMIRTVAWAVYVSARIQQPMS
jgi:hypothetical protein